jgi:hypothetical protein
VLIDGCLHRFEAIHNLCTISASANGNGITRKEKTITTNQNKKLKKELRCFGMARKKNPKQGNDETMEAHIPSGQSEKKMDESTCERMAKGSAAFEVEGNRRPETFCCIEICAEML